MTDYNYLGEFDGIAGTIDGSDFDPHFVAIDDAIASKANIAGPQSFSGAHTFPTLNGTIGNISTLNVLVAMDATAVAMCQFTGINAASVAGVTLAGAADTTHIDGGTWA